MLKGLMNIILKEIKELVRDPKVLLPMIVIPLVMFPLMGFAIETSMETAQQSIGETSIALIDQDQGPYALSLQTFMTASNFSITYLEDITVEDALVEVQDSNLTSLIIIPSGRSCFVYSVNSASKSSTILLIAELVFLRFSKNSDCFRFEPAMVSSSGKSFCTQWNVTVSPSTFLKISRTRSLCLIIASI